MKRMKQKNMLCSCISSSSSSSNAHGSYEKRSLNSPKVIFKVDLQLNAAPSAAPIPLRFIRIIIMVLLLLLLLFANTLARSYTQLVSLIFASIAIIRPSAIGIKLFSKKRAVLSFPLLLPHFNLLAAAAALALKSGPVRRRRDGACNKKGAVFISF